MKAALLFHAAFFGFDAGAAALAGFHVFVAKLVAEVELHEAAFRLVGVGRVHTTGEHIALVLLGVEHYAWSAFASTVLKLFRKSIFFERLSS